MNDLLRPTLYGVYHDIRAVRPRSGEQVATIVGPVCETGDTFAVDRTLPRCAAGELVAILGAGAYGASMSSTYNSRPLPAEVLVEDGRYALIRQRQSFDAMIADEQPARYWNHP